ncbi:MAG: nucleotidyltransferase family protein, partial [Desulfobacterales bacterium]|nr:nucleotidyltransferase family protein [Desulfobacterales bacterium]
MKAFILAAGMGTRLRPYTNHTPKPLFPIGGRPLIDHTIHRLEKAGFTDIAINLHHLAGQITQHINRQDYQARIRLLHEPQILGTGGGIKNLGDFWNNGPLLVINSDILTDIDLKAVYDDHVTRQNAATLVVHDRPEFNTVAVAADNAIVSFSNRNGDRNNTPPLAFTGIQVIEPEFNDYTPAAEFFASIPVYQAMIKAGCKVRAYRVQDHFWEDLGTPRRYLRTVTARMARETFCEAFDYELENEPVSTKLKGDGSDRKWHRFSSGPHTLIAVEHGIRPTAAVCEADAFVNIGR